jgi:hypothetical protein
MASLKEHFCLTRNNFLLNPKASEADRDLFFGTNRNHEIVTDIENRYLAGDVARYYIYGNYGTGKTHLLYHLKAHFEQHDDVVNIRPYIVQVEAQSGSRYQSLHRRMLDAIGVTDLERAFSQFVAQISDYDERHSQLLDLFPSENAVNAMGFLQSSQQNRTLAWRWLSGEKLSSPEQQQLAVTSILSDTGDLVDLMTAIGELFRANDENLLFLIDESESIHNVSNRDAQISWHDAFRRLAGEDNQSVGFMLTFYTNPSYPPPAFLEEGDITTRLGEYGIIRLEAMETPELQKFLKDLLREFVDKDLAEAVIAAKSLDTEHGVYPFDRDGYSAFAEEAQNHPDRTIPRTIIRAITASAIEALRTGADLINAEIVDQKGREEFSAQ